MNHTPEPWIIEENGCYIILDNDGNEIARLPKGKLRHCANVHLVASAPKLLEACRDLLDAFWDMSPLQYAQSRGLPFMSDEEGERIKERARETIAEAEELK